MFSALCYSEFEISTFSKALISNKDIDLSIDKMKKNYTIGSMEMVDIDILWWHQKYRWINIERPIQLLLNNDFIHHLSRIDIDSVFIKFVWCSFLVEWVFREIEMKCSNFDSIFNQQLFQI